MNNKTKLIVISCFWLILALIMIFVNEKIFLTGKSIDLAVHPIDPNDLLRGQYVRLEYDISKIKLKHNFELKNNDTAYVSLVKDPDTNIYNFKNISKTRPENDLYIKGKIHRIYNSYRRNSDYNFEIYINYGIENFFTNEKEAKRLESELSKKGGIATVIVDSNGNARVKNVR